MTETGVPNLDLILGGGIPEGDVLLAIGPAGSGKTTLALQVAFHIASRGENVLYISTASEAPPRLIKHISSFSFFDETLVGKRLFLLMLYPLVAQGIEKTIDTIIQAAKDRQAKLVIVDGLTTLRDLYPRTTEMRAFMYQMGAALASLDAMAILTSLPAESLEEGALPELTMADGIVELDIQNLGTRTVRTIRASKMRGLAPLLGQHSLRIDGNGLTVFPRLESVFEFRDVGLKRGRVPMGLPELDAMMRGGFPQESVTLLVGSMGAGKTLACLQYLVEGTRRGEKGLFIGFRESPRQLIDKARAFGMDLETPIKDGLVTILFHPQADLVADEVTWEIRHEIERLAPKRVALDSVVELEFAIVDPQRRRGYLAVLAGMLRGAGVTSFITKETAQWIGAERDFSDTPLAFVAENLILLRYIEFRGELVGIISIVKMRDTDFDRSIRQFTIADTGFKVLGKMESAEGVLTGIARLPSEARWKGR